ncbi:MAG: erythromycin esterase family protein, partial [Dysgonamonadaceae bacterium]|nr:erythromycin esterase family protein [Dysgonamonadaceae bacterium]
MNSKRKFYFLKPERTVFSIFFGSFLLSLIPAGLFSQTIAQHLSFEMVNNCSWDWKVTGLNARFLPDSLVLCDNRPSLRITFDKTIAHRKDQIFIRGKRYDSNDDSRRLSVSREDSLKQFREVDTLQFILSKNILLPFYRKGQKCRISIKSMTKNVRDLKLQVAKIGRDENFIDIDTVFIENETGQWKEHELAFTLSDEKALEIGISYAGTGDSCRQINMGNPVLYIDNKDVGHLDIRLKQYFGNVDTSLEPKYAVLLPNTDDQDFLSGIEGIDNKSIIGLGESMYNSDAILQAKYRFTKNAILHHNCKLALMEYPIDLSLALELYVLGLVDESYGEEVKKDLRGVFGDYLATFEFVRWLRDYNSRTGEKVHLLGIDNPVDSKTLISDFICQLLNKRRIHPYFKLVNSGNLDELAEQLSINDTIKGKVDESTIGLFQEIMKNCLYDSKYYQDEVFFDGKKMFSRLSIIKKAILSEKQKVVILAHSRHLNKMQEIRSRLFAPGIYCLGNYLNNEYPDRYCVISFQTGQGMYIRDLCNDRDFNQKDTLPDAIDGSFEKSALNMNLDYFLYPSPQLNENILSRRIVTQGWNQNQFKYGSLKRQFDAYVFI